MTALNFNRYMVIMKVYMPQGSGFISDFLYPEQSDVYHTRAVFEMDYEEMEREFKVYAYPGADLKMYYRSPRGYFFKNLNESRFLTRDPEQSHLFFVPLSTRS